ncbi:MAG: hypothetical protein HQL31_12355, partial [Planctomycetes bacterium]|nr:hypothetical protein [Planctomycetota bacterium]
MSEERRRNQALEILASLKVTVACLLVFCVLTVFGTVYQVENGIHAAKERYFTSWYFLAWSFLPVPGAKAVMGIFSINLVASLLLRIKYIWRDLGLFLTHVGLLTFCAASVWTYAFSVESHLSLREGEASNVATSSEEWELALWRDSEGMRSSSAFTLRSGSSGVLNYDEAGIAVRIAEYHVNCSPVPGSSSDLESPSGYKGLVGAPSQQEVSYNLPGGIFEVLGARQKILLVGAGKAASLSCESGLWHLALQRRRQPLPV